MIELTMANKRLKSYNYTERRDNLQKVVTKAKESQPLELIEATSQTISALGQAAGYTYRSSHNPAIKKTIIDVISEIWPPNERIEDLRRIAIKAEDAGQFAPAIKAIDLAMRGAGDIKSIQDVNVNGTIEHQHTQGSPDYLKYKQQRQNHKLIIDGEIVETTENTEKS